MHEEWTSSNGGVRWGLGSLAWALQCRLIHLDFMRIKPCSRTGACATHELRKQATIRFRSPGS
ncbi:hypothetical protein C2845_PM03G18650 [Panicum miliaceum]|uniref:Uncharacterized protein n=1 Tax=Panicum miliaceum TaxID=4540 RepID=A0A3L6TI96_PANMI|nr:hypothetical protein C2845_PM03G18650 [Panicum miliaceum]